MSRSAPLLQLLTMVVGLLLTLPALAGRPDLEATVVEILVTYQSYDAMEPWDKKRPGLRSAHAIVLEDGRLLTTAQAVADATLVRVEAFGRPDRAPAHVVHVDRDINLALLALDDPAFGAELEGLPFARSTPTTGEVLTVGWNNRQLERSRGEIGRVEVREAVTGEVEHVHLLVNTTYPNGGDAEPVLLRGRLIGLVASQSDETARVVPVHILSSYLAAVDGPGDYPGFAAPRMWWQINRDPAQAAWLGHPAAPKGIVIRRVWNGTTACGTLQPRDVLLSIDGFPIDGNGTIDHPTWGRIRFGALFVEQGRTAGDTLPITVLREGQTLQTELTLRRFSAGSPLIPDPRTDHAPPYAIVGGLVIRELDDDYVEALGDRWRRRVGLAASAAYNLEGYQQTDDRRRMLIVSSVLPHAYNLGYHDVDHALITTVNGQPVDRVSDVVTALQTPLQGYHVVTVRTGLGQRDLVLDASTYEVAQQAILDAYGIAREVRLDTGTLPSLQCSAP